MKNLMIKAITEVVAKLDNIESVSFRFTPYSHDGYEKLHLVIQFRDDEKGEEREGKMYLYNIQKQQWELYI